MVLQMSRKLSRRAVLAGLTVGPISVAAPPKPLFIIREVADKRPSALPADGLSAARSPLAEKSARPALGSSMCQATSITWRCEGDDGFGTKRPIGNVRFRSLSGVKRTYTEPS
jgi:hypothetical protein